MISHPMTLRTTKPFDRDFAFLSESIKEQAEKQFALLLQNPRHPSLHVKKMKGKWGKHRNLQMSKWANLQMDESEASTVCESPPSLPGETC